jgi:hypothetical protein
MFIALLYHFHTILLEICWRGTEVQEPIGNISSLIFLNTLKIFLAHMCRFTVSILRDKTIYGLTDREVSRFDSQT